MRRSMAIFGPTCDGTDPGGFEPPTFWSGTRYSIQTEPRAPVQVIGTVGSSTIRVIVCHHRTHGPPSIDNHTRQDDLEDSIVQDGL